MMLHFFLPLLIHQVGCAEAKRDYQKFTVHTSRRINNFLSGSQNSHFVSVLLSRIEAVISLQQSIV